MSILFAVPALAAGFAGTFLFAWVGFFPRIGPVPLLRASLWKALLALLSLSLAAIGYVLLPSPGSLAVWATTGLLAALT